MKTIFLNRSRIFRYMLALTLLLCLAGCKKEPKSNRPNMDTLRAAEVGSYVFFGEYEQDGNEATGKEAIEWLVLDKQDDKMLVISRYGLDYQPYNTEYDEVTWETCSLREWLNSDFYDAAFIPEEKKVILDSVNMAYENPEYDTWAGNDTTDKVFLLSYLEARIYLSGATRACMGTPYCYDQGAFKGDNGNCQWWLRTPGSTSYVAASIFPGGSIVNLGYSVNDTNGGVRPAMWIDLTA